MRYPPAGAGEDVPDVDDAFAGLLVGDGVGLGGGLVDADGLGLGGGLLDGGAAVGLAGGVAELAGLAGEDAEGLGAGPVLSTFGAGVATVCGFGTPVAGAFPGLVAREDPITGPDGRATGTIGWWGPPLPPAAGSALSAQPARPNTTIPAVATAARAGRRSQSAARKPAAGNRPKERGGRCATAGDWYPVS